MYFENDPKEPTMPADDVKPGKTTTEFWGKLLVQMSVLAASLFGVDQIPLETAMIIVSGIEAIYVVGRSFVKGRAAKSPDTLTVNGTIKEDA